MATSKLLKPTNVTIQIPEFTDQPDQRVNSNCIDKAADAINALNDNMAQLIVVKTGTTPNTLNTNAQFITDSSLMGHYVILGYSIYSKSNVWVSASTNIAHIYIDSTGIKMNVANNDLANCNALVMLYKVN